MAPDLDRAHLEAFFNRSPDAIVIVRENGEISHANDRVEDLFGYAPEELVGEPVERLIPEEDREDHPPLREAYMSDPETRSMGAGLDLRGRRKDGSTVPVDISLSSIETEAGSDRLVMASIRDISRRETLERKYRAVFEVAPDAMFIADAETGELLEVNRRAADLIGAPKDDIVGRHQTELHPPAERDRYRELFETAAESTEIVQLRSCEGEDLHVVTDDDERVPIEISAQVLESRVESEGGLVIGAFRNIAPQKEYEQKLHHQIDRLERFAHLLSHDLRNPLSVASGYLEQARETDDSDYLDRVEAEHERIEDIIDDVLTMVRHGYEVESVDPLDVESVVTECWNRAGADVDLEIESQGLVYADPDRVRNLFENLFRNAAEHAGTDATVRVGLLEDGDGFYVEDDGPGIPPADRDDVFEPGWTTAADGTGLGLNIVYEVARAHDWTVEIEDGRDGGARFVFTGVRTAVADGSFEGDA
ncbi:PAS domain S-box-containing protein [Halobiforma haloterrestris]|uniref:histidine kinase n=1 Tax=Natronobacterium haloterrestre TaxID=148448 RepID=A0A1I1EZF8_NATHA|nr:PAS domain S-box protein [Halobiforma haloterrestris]SFB92391.1 PAS domain S-box-containing protein [Halobiforma haloterrestris]